MYWVGRKWRFLFDHDGQWLTAKKRHPNIQGAELFAVGYRRYDVMMDDNRLAQIRLWPFYIGWRHR